MKVEQISQHYLTHGNKDKRLQALELRKDGKNLGGDGHDKIVRPRLKEGKQTRARELKEPGWSHEEIADELDTGTKTVRRGRRYTKIRHVAEIQSFRQPAEPQLKTSVNELVDFILDNVGRPSELMAVAALLETYGIRDKDARETWGAGDVFALAEHVYAKCLASPVSSPHSADHAVRLNWSESVQRLAKTYVGAVLYDAAFFMQAIVLLIFGYNLGFYTLFAPRETSIVIGVVILSFIVSGGLIRAIGFAGSYYIGQQNYVLAGRMIRRIMIAGIGGIVFLSLAGELANYWFFHFSPAYMTILVTYFSLFAGILLFSAVMYSLQQSLGLFVMSVVGLVVVIAIMNLTDQNIYAAHVIGMISALVTATAWLVLAFKSQRLTGSIRRGGELPPLRYQITALLPHFAYGTLYYLFSTISRIVAYFFIASSVLTFSVRQSFEGGLIWALLPFLLVGPVLEGSAQMLVKDLAERLSNQEIIERKSQNSAFTAYLVPVTMMLSVFIVLSVLIYFGVMWLREANYAFIADLFSQNPGVMIGVFGWASLGNTLLLLGLLNTSFLQSSRKLWLPTKAIALAVIVNLVVGMFANHFWGYEYSMIGFVLGALSFALVTSKGVWEILKEADYHEYSAYWNYSM